MCQIELRAIPETIELDLYIRKAAPRRGSMDQTQANQRKTLHMQLADCQCIGIWGAGGKTLSYGNLLSEELAIIHLFDSAPEKTGKYIGSIPVPVESVSLEAVYECDAVVIFATAYNVEIIKALQETFHYPGKIIYFESSDVKECAPV